MRKRRIARAMALGVVDFFQVVEIYENKARLHPVALNQAKGAAQFAHESAAIEYVEQRITVGQALKLADSLLRPGKLLAQALHLLHQRDQRLAHARRQLRLGDAGENDLVRRRDAIGRAWRIRTQRRPRRARAVCTRAFSPPVRVAKFDSYNHTQAAPGPVSSQPNMPSRSLAYPASQFFNSKLDSCKFQLFYTSQHTPFTILMLLSVQREQVSLHRMALATASALAQLEAAVRSRFRSNPKERPSPRPVRGGVGFRAPVLGWRLLVSDSIACTPVAACYKRRFSGRIRVG